MGAVKKIEEIKQEFEGIESAYRNTISEINKSWHTYWYEHFKKRFTNNALLQEVAWYENRIEEVYKESSSWLNENISLGIQIDDLKHQINILKEKNLELKNKVKVYEADKSIVKRFAQSVKLKTENQFLKEHNNELKVKAAVTGATVLSERQEKQIIDMYNVIVSKSGMLTKQDREVIAKKVGTSESTVYRRIKKHEQQQ